VSVWALSALVALMLSVSLAPSKAWATGSPAADRCASDRLDDARVRASVTLQHEHRTYTKIVTSLTADVPGDWPYARDLLLSPDSRHYIRAMSCLTRSEQGEQRRWTEWRVGEPAVTWKDGRAKVVYRAHSWANEYRSYMDVGLWRFRAGAERWSLRLAVPPALKGAQWDEITVDPGTPGAEWAKPRPTAGKGPSALVWRPGAEHGAQEGRKTAAEKHPVPVVEVGLTPSWQRSWSAQSSRSIVLGLDGLGRLLWVGAVSALLLTAVRWYRRRPGTPTAEQLRTLGNLRAWAVRAVLLFSVVHADLLIENAWASFNGWMSFQEQLFLEYGLALLAICVLLRFAGWSRRRIAGVVLLLNPVVVVFAVGLTHIRIGVGPALAVQGLLGACFLALTLLAAVAVLWRLAVEGQLLPKSRRHPGNDRVLRARIAWPAVVVATVAVAVCYALAEERDWQRASWLSDPAGPGNGTDRLEDYLWQVMWSVSFGQEQLINDQLWLFACVALLAALRAWRRPASVTPLDDPADRLLLLTFFAVTAGLNSGNHLASSLLTSLWIPLNMLALYGTTAFLARRSVLAQPFEFSGRPLATVTGPAARTALLRKARSYREIHAELRRLDQGLFGDVPPQRDDLERRLERLHDWPVSAPPVVRDRLPARVSVVDAALALGPRDDWWDNGRRGALFALIPGLPAALLGTWSWHIRGEGWQDTLSDFLGFPGLLLDLVHWTVAWCAAGFVLGALWRVLPGRRGAVKTLPVAAAFALPVGLDTLVGWFTRESTSNEALHLSLMLFVLTVTAIALDFDTFGGERRYWQSRFGLLLSVYQMRYYSLQVAYLIAQLIAMITIWQFFTEPDIVPSQDGTPPDTDGSGPAQ
jgi:hypothetical protein